MMGSEKEKEEIIELTEVLEEGAAFAAKNGRPERPAPGGPKTPPRPPGANDSLSPLPVSAAKVTKEATARQTETWAAQEGTRLPERLAGEFIPRIVAEKLASELEKLKAETDALRARGEAFSRELEERFSSQGLKFLEQKARETVPGIAAEALRAEIEPLKRELETFQSLKEDLDRQAQTWFAGEGRRILENAIREVFPQVAEKILRQEIEKLKDEGRASENE